MKIDTLILPACGTKFLAYIGAFKYLFENNVIDIKNIKEIKSCSAGSFVSFILQTSKSLNILENFVYKYDFNNLLNFNDLNNFFEGNGLFSNEKIILILSKFLEKIYHVTDITFIELYKKTKIKNTIKVYNLSLEKNEYICHENHPNLSVLKAIKMSISIPIIFKPVIHNDNYYIDGGITGVIPSNKNKNYLIIYVYSKINNKITPLNEFDYIMKIIKTFGISSKYTKNKRIINIPVDSDCIIDFDIKHDKIKYIINNAYNICCNKYK